MASDQVSVRLDAEQKQILDICALLHKTNPTAYATSLLHDHIRDAAENDADVQKVLEAQRHVAAKTSVPDLRARRASTKKG